MGRHSHHPRCKPGVALIDATYQSSDGQQYGVSGHINQDPRKFTMAIAFGNPPQQFSGLLYGHELGLAAGTTTWAGIPFGFAMVRTGAVTSVHPTPTEVTRPTDTNRGSVRRPAARMPEKALLTTVPIECLAAT